MIIWEECRGTDVKHLSILVEEFISENAKHNQCHRYLIKIYSNIYLVINILNILGKIL